MKQLHTIWPGTCEICFSQPGTHKFRYTNEETAEHWACDQCWDNMTALTKEQNRHVFTEQ